MIRENSSGPCPYRGTPILGYLLYLGPGCLGSYLLFFIFPDGCGTPRSGGRAGGGPISWCVVFEFFEFVWGSTGPERYLMFFVVKFYVECIQNHVRGPLGALVLNLFVKAFIFVKVEKSVNNYIRWCSQSTKRVDLGGHYAG